MPRRNRNVGSKGPRTTPTDHDSIADHRAVHRCRKGNGNNRQRQHREDNAGDHRDAELVIQEIVDMARQQPRARTSMEMKRWYGTTRVTHDVALSKDFARQLQEDEDETRKVQDEGGCQRQQKIERDGQWECNTQSDHFKQSEDTFSISAASQSAAVQHALPAFHIDEESQDGKEDDYADWELIELPEC